MRQLDWFAPRTIRLVGLADEDQPPPAETLVALDGGFVHVRRGGGRGPIAVWPASALAELTYIDHSAPKTPAPPAPARRDS